jgi:hypothetical protein
LRCRFFQRVLYRFEGLEFDSPGLAIQPLDFADVDVLHNVTGSGVDSNRSTRAFPRHALHCGDQGVRIGIAAGLFQRRVYQVHAIIAAEGYEVRTVTSGLRIGCNIELVDKRRVRSRIDAR